MYRPLLFDTEELPSPQECVCTCSLEVCGVTMGQGAGQYYVFWRVTFLTSFLVI